MKLKKAPNKGVTQLPKDVRNKMGFMGKGGAVKVKYKEGGKITEKEMDKIQNRADDENRFESTGEDYLQQRASEITDNGKLLKFLRVKETASGLERMGITVKGATPDKILSMGKTKGVDAMSKARSLFDIEIGKRNR